MAKKAFLITAVVIFAAMLTLPTLVWGILIALGGDGFIEEKIVAPIESADGENRKIMSFAAVTEGKILEDGTVLPFELNDITANIEALYDDYAPFRASLVTVKDKMTFALERPYKEKIEPALVELFYGNVAEEEQEVQNNDTTAPSIDDIFGPSTEATTDTTEEEEPYIPPPDAEVIGGDPDCNHSFGESVTEVPAKCDEHGSTLADCSKCDAQLREYTEATGHAYVEVSSEPATCFESGVSYQSCSACEREKNVELPALGHDGMFIEKVETSYLDCGYTLYKCERCDISYREDIVPKLIDTSIYPVSYNGSKKVIYGRYDWLFYTGDNMEKRFTGDIMMTEKEMQQLTHALDALNLELKKHGTTLVIALWPNKCDMYGEYMPTYGKTAEINTSEVLINYINEHKETDFIAIYPKAELMAVKSYYQTYYKFDTHWNAAGGYMGAQAIYKALGMETTDIRTVKATKVDARLRMIISVFLSAAEQVKYANVPDTEYLFDYRPEVKVKELGAAAYKDWVDGNAELYTTSDSQNDKSLVFLGDSYRNAIAPYLKKDFSKAIFGHANTCKAHARNIIESDVFVLARVARLDRTLLTLVPAIKNAIVELES